MELSAKTARAIRVYEPVKTEGLTLYPILMQEYESFLQGKSAISFLARSLPLEYLSQPLLSAFYRHIPFVRTFVKSHPFYYRKAFS